MADLPPAPDMRPPRPERVTVLLEPRQKVVANRLLRPFKRRPHSPRRIVEHFIERVVGDRMVVVPAPENVPAIAGNVDVLCLWRIDERIHRQVSFQAAPMI